MKKLPVKGNGSVETEVPIKHDEKEIDETEELIFFLRNHRIMEVQADVWTPKHKEDLKAKEAEKSKQQKDFLSKLANKEIEKNKPKTDYDIEETDQPTPRMSGVPNEPDFTGGEMVEDEEDTSDFTNPTKQHSGVMKAVNVEESEMVKRFKRNARIKETEEEKPSMQRIIKYINKVANSDNPTKLIKPGTNFEAEPNIFTPPGRKPKPIPIPYPKKLRTDDEENEPIDEEEKQKSDYWKTHHRVDHRNDRIQRGRDVLGDEENNCDFELKKY